MEENHNNQQTVPEAAPTPKQSPIGLPAAILTAAVVIAIAIMVTFGQQQSDRIPASPRDTEEVATTVPESIATVRPGEHLRGSTNAEIVVIEYSDSDCPYCAQFHTTMQDILATYNGKVAWVYRHYPLTSLHPNAKNEALALECVGDLAGGKAFWMFLDTIMGVTLSKNDTGLSTLTTLALQSGVDGPLFTSCIEQSTTMAAIDTSIAEAQEIGARGTPFSIAINQKTGKQTVIPGAYPFENMKRIIDSLME